jgi:hypothetical protein
MKALITGCVALAGAVLFLASERAGAKDKKDLGPKLFEAELVRTEMLPADAASIIPFPWSNDPLRDGSVEVRGKGFVSIELEGAAPEAQYTVLACRLSQAGDRCAAIGPVQTDAKGDARADLEWRAPAAAYALFFALQRNNATMFVSGFAMPAGPPPVSGTPASAEIEIRGVIATVGANSFTIAGVAQAIVTDQNTKYLGTLKGFADLKPGLKVEVSGATTAAGTILASRIQPVK